MNPPGAVVIGGYANGVSTLRGLATAGVRTAVVLTRPSDVAHYSRHAHEVHWAPDPSLRADALLTLLDARRDRWHGWALIPTNDSALQALARNRWWLSRWYAVTVPDEELVRCVLDKRETRRMAEAVGVDLPRCYGAASSSTASRPSIAFPVVVKAADGARFWRLFRRKLFVARDRRELQGAVLRVEAAGIDAEIYDLVPGSDRQFHNYTVYLDGRGEPVAEFGFRKLRKAPPFYGVARAAEVASVPELRERSLALLRRIGWRGIASLEYKLDPRDGRYRLMEINGRCFLANALATRSGINYPLLAWREHSLGERVSATPNDWRGVWLHLHADLLYSAVQARGEDWSWAEFFRSYRRPWVDAVWSRDDPWPFVAQWIDTARRGMRSLGDARVRQSIRARFQPMPALAPSARDIP